MRIAPQCPGGSGSQWGRHTCRSACWSNLSPARSPVRGLLEEPNYLLRRHDTLGGVKMHAIGVNGTARAVHTLAISSTAIIRFVFTSTLKSIESGRAHIS